MVLRFQVQAGPQQRVRAALAAARPLTLTEPGTRLFEANRDAEDATRFVIYERWDSLRDLDKHLRTLHVAALRSMAPDFKVLAAARTRGTEPPRVNRRKTRLALRRVTRASWTMLYALLVTPRCMSEGGCHAPVEAHAAVLARATHCLLAGD